MNDDASPYGHADTVIALLVELRRLRTENEEQGKRIDNLLGEQVAGIGFMRERDALLAKIEAALAIANKVTFTTESVLGIRAALTGEATE